MTSQLSDGGRSPDYDGDDYGLYQIYGKHILAGPNSLLYVGQATEQTFAGRFRQHQQWLKNEYPGIYVHVGRLYMPERHVWANGGWGPWAPDVQLAERILIYKYSPHYNSFAIAEAPDLLGFTRVFIEHSGSRGRLEATDVAPRDWE